MVTIEDDVAHQNWKKGFTTHTWTAVFDSDEGCEVLGVVAEHYRVFVAFCGRPVEWQINPAHIQRRDGGARFHTPDNLV